MTNEARAEPAAAEAFWEFAVAVYTQPGVSERCLALQEEHAVDVNILLLAAWLGAARGQSLSCEQAGTLIAETAHWREHVVQAMRSLRRRLKRETEARPEADDVYQAMKAAELEGERLEQRILLAVLERLALAPASSGAGRAVALANMKAYLAALGTRSARTSEAQLEAVAAAADRQA